MLGVEDVQQRRNVRVRCRRVGGGRGGECAACAASDVGIGCDGETCRGLLIASASSVTSPSTCADTGCAVSPLLGRVGLCED